MNFSFNQLDFSTLYKNNTNNEENIIKKYDKTTTETYRIKRIFKIDPLNDTEIESSLLFPFKYKWDPYTGEREELDEVGPLCFNAFNLYDYYFNNRYKGLWNPSEGLYEGFYGDLIGSGKNLHIKSRGFHPEKYLFRLPIIDCYLPDNHNYSIITMGPVLNSEEIDHIDKIINSNHSYKHKKNWNIKNLTPLSTLKLYYDNAINSSPDPNCKEIIELRQQFPSFNNMEINDKYNRYFVDKLVKLKY